MNILAQGVSSTQTPFITTILAPQLRARRLPLAFVSKFQELPNVQATYTLVDGAEALHTAMADKQRLQGYLRAQRVSVALVLNKSYQQKLALLELGFTHCLELPIATELIIRTIENGVLATSYSSPTKTQLRDRGDNYQADSKLHYLFDKYGRAFLTNYTKSIYINLQEQRILDYLLNRTGYASRNELSYAGWKHFEARSNTITVTIRKLKGKLHKLSLPYSIHSLYGYGYTLRRSQNDFSPVTNLDEVSVLP
jgi:DNA-binding response OmpR family regulator